jgi:hypothetical protein
MCVGKKGANLNGALPMPYQVGEAVSAAPNGIDRSNEFAQHEFRHPKRSRAAQQDRIALAEAQQRATIAEQRLDDLRATLAELRQERDAWREQAQRLALREKPPVQRPAWWLWGRSG